MACVSIFGGPRKGAARGWFADVSGGRDNIGRSPESPQPPTGANKLHHQHGSCATALLCIQAKAKPKVAQPKVQSKLQARKGLGNELTLHKAPCACSCMKSRGLCLHGCLLRSWIEHLSQYHGAMRFTWLYYGIPAVGSVRRRVGGILHEAAAARSLHAGILSITYTGQVVPHIIAQRCVPAGRFHHGVPARHPREPGTCWLLGYHSMLGSGMLSKTEPGQLGHQHFHGLPATPQARADGTGPPSLPSNKY